MEFFREILFKKNFIIKILFFKEMSLNKREILKQVTFNNQNSILLTSTFNKKC